MKCENGCGTTISYDEHHDSWACVLAFQARVSELEAFVAAVRKHILGECPGLTSADCIEAIRIDLHTLEARTPVDTSGTGEVKP